MLYLGYGENDEIYSLEYKVESNEKEKSIVFVYEDDKMIGQYVSEKREEMTYECFIVDDNEKLFYMINSNNDFELDETKKLNAASITSPDNQKYTKISSSSAVYLVGTATTGYITKVANVINDFNNSGEGLCWTASGASIINYLKGKNYICGSF